MPSTETYDDRIIRLFLLAAAFWGVVASPDLPTRALLAVGAPAALVVVWALFIAPRAVFPIPRVAQALAGGLLLEVAAVALVAAGQPIIGIAFGGLIAIDTAALAIAESGR